MSDATMPTTADLRTIRESYLAQVKRRRLYGGITLLIFVLLLVSGFSVADSRNAGGFWDGLHQIGDYPADVLSEAWAKRADLKRIFPYVGVPMETTKSCQSVVDSQILLVASHLFHNLRSKSTCSPTCVFSQPRSLRLLPQHAALQPLLSLV